MGVVGHRKVYPLAKESAMRTSTAVRNFRHSRRAPDTEDPGSGYLLILAWVTMMALLSLVLVLA